MAGQIKANMMQYLKSQDINPSSIAVYSHYYVNIIKNCFDLYEPENMLDVNVVKKILKYVDTLDKTLNVKIGHLIAWRKICELKNIVGDMSPILKMLRRYNDDQMFKEATHNELKNKINIKYIEKMRDQYKQKINDDFTINDVYHLLCSLYTYMLPLRSEDYYNTLIMESNGSFLDFDRDISQINYYDPIKKQLFLNHYKTSKSHGQRVIDIPDILHDIIMEFHHKSKSPYLVCSTKSNPLSSVSFTITFKRCLKKDVSSSMIRKCFISDKMDNGMNADDRKKAAKIMGHTVCTQMTTYSKFSDALHPDKDNLQYWIRRNEQLTAQLEEANRNIRRLL
jgi:hypothetical protein